MPDRTDQPDAAAAPAGAKLTREDLERALDIAAEHVRLNRQWLAERGALSKVPRCKSDEILCRLD